jgi:tetratricopeptide (TPR) repeat protein
MPTSAMPAFTGPVSPDPAAFFNDRVFEWLQRGESLPAFGTGSRDPAEYFYDRGFNFQRRGEYLNAINDYSTAIRMNPGHARAYHNRGLAYRLFGKQSKAQADFDKAKQLGYTGPE